MTFEEEWEILRKESLNERLKIYDKYPTADKQLDNWPLERDLKEERKRFHAKLAELKKKYGR